MGWRNDHHRTDGKRFGGYHGIVDRDKIAIIIRLMKISDLDVTDITIRAQIAFALLIIAFAVVYFLLLK